MGTVRIRFEGQLPAAHQLAAELRSQGCTVDVDAGMEYRSLPGVAQNVVTLVVETTQVAVWVASAVRTWKRKHPTVKVALEDDWRNGGGYL